MLTFPAQSRLKSRVDFHAIWNDGIKVSTFQWLGFYIRNNTNRARVGIIIKKQILKHATQRNLARRLVRESFRHHAKSLKGLDVIIMIRSNCGRLDKKNLRDNIDKLWLQLANKQLNYVLRR